MQVTGLQNLQIQNETIAEYIIEYLVWRPEVDDDHHNLKV